jgi:N-methylhydantoinase B
VRQPRPAAGEAAVDPATFAVVRNALYAIAEEMGVVLAKTAYSPLLKAGGDYSCALFDCAGEMVAQGNNIPTHLGSMPLAVQAVIRAWEAFRPGDVFIHNDPYFGGAHLPDVNVVTPVFHEARQLGFACVRAHWPDVGGAVPGSYGTTTEIFGEGLRMPPVRLRSGGEVNRDVEAVIFANVRVPAERRGDLRAQIAANRRAEQRMAALAAKHGATRLIAIMDEVKDHSERMMRQAIATLPDGKVRFEARADGIADDADGSDAPIRLVMTVTKAGDALEVDMTGSQAQVAGPMNAPLAVTASGVYTAVKMVADPTNLIPPNSGCWRPIRVTAPQSTVTNATYPAPVVYANHEISHLVCEMFFGALAQAVPDRVMACSNATGGILTLGGVDPRTGGRYVSYENVKGGMGARPNKDGVNAIYTGISNGMNVPVEILETSFPVRVRRYEIVPDSGGAGRYRGGCGVLRVWRMLGSDGMANVCLERTVDAPFGLFGGDDGGRGRITLVMPDGERRELASKASFAVPAGAEVWLQAPGSGGYGPAAARAPEALRDDLLNGYVSEDAASRLYGR